MGDGVLHGVIQHERREQGLKSDSARESGLFQLRSSLSCNALS